VNENHVGGVGVEEQSRRALKWIIIGLLGVIGLTVLSTNNADAHPEHLYPEDGVMTVELARHRSSWLGLMALERINGPYEEVIVNDRPPNRGDVASPPLAPADIRVLVGAYFPPSEVNNALAVIFCESRFNPSARNGSHIGLFQIAGFWWRSFNLDPYDPTNNVYMGWQIWLQGHPRAGDGPNFGHWVCQPDGSYWYF